jgi:hypothetical protein
MVESLTEVLTIGYRPSLLMYTVGFVDSELLSSPAMLNAGHPVGLPSRSVA